jgi:hypothetical protein
MSFDSKFWVILILILFVVLPVVAGFFAPLLKKLGIVEY